MSHYLGVLSLDLAFHEQKLDKLKKEYEDWKLEAGTQLEKQK